MPQLERLCTTHAGIMEWDRYCMTGNIWRVLVFCGKLKKLELSRAHTPRALQPL